MRGYNVARRTVLSGLSFMMYLTLTVSITIFFLVTGVRLILAFRNSPALVSGHRVSNLKKVLYLITVTKKDGEIDFCDRIKR